MLLWWNVDTLVLETRAKLSSVKVQVLLGALRDHGAIGRRGKLKPYLLIVRVYLIAQTACSPTGRGGWLKPSLRKGSNPFMRT